MLETGSIRLTAGVVNRRGDQLPAQAFKLAQTLSPRLFKPMITEADERVPHKIVLCGTLSQNLASRAKRHNPWPDF